jgi:hypothetical protein
MVQIWYQRVFTVFLNKIIKINQKFRNVQILIFLFKIDADSKFQYYPTSSTDFGTKVRFGNGIRF